MITSSTSEGLTAGAFSSSDLTMKPPRSSMRASMREPLKARPMGVLAVATITASGILCLPLRVAVRPGLYGAGGTAVVRGPGRGRSCAGGRGGPERRGVLQPFLQADLRGYLNLLVRPVETG